MKLYTWAAALTSAIVVTAFFLSDAIHPLGWLAMPGAFIAFAINESFPDRTIRVYLFLMVFFNCVLYSAVVLIAIWLYRKIRKTR